MRAARILLVEDNPSDVRLTVEAMKEGKVESDLTVVGDGEEALEFLNRTGNHQDAVRPDLILLDLNLPKRSGHEVLAEIKSSPDLKSIPVVVLTTSSDEDDIQGTYELHANCYITKPADLDQFIGVVRQIDEFWLHVACLPARTTGRAR
jgi:two-component system, chemotaxis family, response regulator Rcp1